jgi:hypothetical protein
MGHKKNLDHIGNRTRVHGSHMEQPSKLKQPNKQGAPEQELEMF